MSQAPAVCSLAARSLRAPSRRGLPLVRGQHPDHGDGRADPGRRRRLADVRHHARSAGAGDGRARRGGALHRPRAAGRARRRRPRSPADRAGGAGRPVPLRGRRWPSASALFLARGRTGRLDPLAIYGVIVICGAARSFLLAGAQRARRRGRAAPALPERGRLADRASGRSRRSPARRWAASSTPGSAPTSSYAIAAALMAVALVTVARIEVARAPARRAGRVAGGERARGAGVLCSRAPSSWAR